MLCDKGSTKARPQGEESMGIFCVEPRNTGYEPTIMGTSSNWTGEKGLKDLVMPTCLAPSDVWPMINAHFPPWNLKGMGKSPWFLLANHRLNGRYNDHLSGHFFGPNLDPQFGWGK